MENNEYDQIAQEVQTSDVENLQANAYVNENVQPDRKAEAIKLANQYKVPVEFAESNFDDFKKKSEAHSPDVYEDIAKNYKGTSEFLKNPDNLGVAKDDLESLKKTEDTHKERGFGSDLLKGLQYGMGKLNQSIAQVPALAYDIAAYPQNKIMQISGSDYRVKSSDIPALKSGFGVVDYYKRGEEALVNELPELNDSVVEQLANKNWDKAGRAIAIQLSASAPQQAAILAAAFFGGPMGAAGLTSMGVTSAASASQEAQAKGLDVASTLPGSVAKGALEVATESLGTFSFVEKWGASLARQLGKEGYKEVMKSFAKTIAASTITEGTEEAVNSIASDFVDYSTGENPAAFEGMLERAINSGIIGAASGGLMTAPTTGAVAFKKSLEVGQANQEKKFYLDLEKGIVDSKLLKRMPEKIQEHVNQVVKDGPMENIYIPVGAFREYFQTKNLSPIEQAAALGIEKEFEAAAEHGGDIKLPTGKWAIQAGSEHYQGLQDDVKFSPEGQTFKEAKAEETQLKEALKSVVDEAKKSETEGKEIIDDVYNQLVATGVPKNEARKQALPYRALKILADRAGVSPSELYQKYGLKILKGEESQAPIEGGIPLMQDKQETALRKDENGDYVYNPEVLNALKSNLDIAPIVQEYQNGKILTEEQTNLLNSKYEAEVNKGELLQEAKATTSTPEFKSWFSGSKVIDESGQPLVVYHGTSRNFKTQYDPDQSRTYGVAAFFSTDPKVAGDFIGGEQGNIRPAYLSIKKPFDPKVDIKVAEEFFDTNGSQYYDSKSEYLKSIEGGFWESLEEPLFIEHLKNNGYDAIITREKNVVNYGVFNPESIRSSFAPAELFQTSNQAPPMFSKLTRTVEEKVPNNATPEQIKATLKELKPEEIKWSGLDEFLKGKTKVNKFELVNFLKANELQVEVVTKGATPNIESYNFALKPTGYSVESDMDGGMSILDPDGVIVDPEEAPKNVQAIIKNIGSQPGTEFSKYTLPGGENYREVLFRLPPAPISQQTVPSEYYDVNNWEQETRPAFKNIPKAEVEADPEYIKEKKNTVNFIKNQVPDMKPKAISDLLDKVISSSFKDVTAEDLGTDDQSVADAINSLKDMYAKKRNPFPKETVYKKRNSLDVGNFVIYNNNMADGGFYTGDQIGKNTFFKTFNEAVDYLQEKSNKTIEERRKDTYKSSHFDETNILAHVRLNDRTDSEGKKVLFVEEIQSDWHQAGRKKGYKGDERIIEPSPQLDPLLEAGDLTVVETAFQYIVRPSSRDNPLYEKEVAVGKGIVGSEDAAKEYALRNYNEKINKTNETIQSNYENRVRDNRVPDAPFKKTWHEFALKRILRMAAEGGYDKVAWTTGEQQNKRYDLSKQVSSIQYNKDSKTLYAEDLKGNPAVEKTGVEEKDLADYIGKDAAEKILKEESGLGKKKDGTFYLYELSGDNLKIGGSGMKGFYDKILVDYANKFVKKFGSKVSADKISDGTLVHSLEITPQLKETALNEGFSLFQQGTQKQGSFNPSTNVIKLFAAKDQSTFFHESGHFFLKVFEDLATAPNASEAIVKDFNIIKEYLGGDLSSVEAQEKWARSFEAYLLKGEAPISSLRKAFNTYKTWLIRIYKNIEGLSKQAGFKVELTPEIVGVMDRMIASEEEINSAQAEVNINTLFKDPISAGMNETQATKYKEAIEESRVYAEAKLTEKLLEDLNKKQSKQYKELYDKYYNENIKRLFAKPIYQALAVLKTGKTYLGQELDQKIKIDKQLVIEKMGQKIAEQMPRNVFGQDGLDYSVIANMFGFESGEAFVQEMIQTPSIQEVARVQANEQIKVEFPDLYKDPEIKVEAKMALHNEKRGQVLKYELEFLQDKYPSLFKDAIRKTVRRSPVDKQVREQAAKIVGGLNTSDLKPHLYLRAEVKASKEAGIKLAKGDIKGAFESKRLEYLNYEIYKAVVEAQADVEKSVKNFKKLFEKTEDLSKKRDIDLINAGTAILKSFGIIKGNNEDPFQYIKKIEKYDPETYGSIQPVIESAMEGADKYSNISYDKFVEMKDTVDALWELSGNIKKMDIDGKSVEITEAAGYLIDQLGKHKSGEAPKAIKQDLSDIEKFKVMLLGAKAALTRVESWSDLMDLGAAGPFKKYIWNPVSEAITKYRLEKKSVIDKYKAIVDEYKDIFKSEAIIVPELDGFIFKNKSNLMMAILHTGNESNKSKLLRGRNWGIVNEDGSLDSSKFDSMISRMQQDGTLTKRDYEFAQKIWDLMESLKPGAQKAHKKMYGYYFNEITASPIQTPWGEFKGGYIPAKVDVYTNEDAAIRKDREELENNNNSFQFPTTGRGFTKARVDAYAAPLSLEINLLGSHIDGVLRFTHVEPIIKQVSRLVINKEFRSNLSDVNPKIAQEALVPWLQRSAQQKVVLPSTNDFLKTTDYFASYLRTATAMQFMVGNFSNALQQVTGIAIAASKVSPAKLSSAFYDYITDGKNVLNSIYEKSDFMKAIQESNIYESQSAINEILTNPTVFDNIRNFAKAHTYFLQSATQNMVNTIVWSGAYNEAVSNGLSEKEAVRSADSAVRTTQGTNNPEDISRFETGTATFRLFTQFAGYFNMLANLQNTEIGKISKTVGLKKGAGKLFYLYVMAFMLPAVLSESIVKLFKGEGFDEEEDGYLNDILSLFFGSQVKTATAMVPFAGQILNATRNGFNKIAYDDRLNFSPVLSVLETGAKVPATIYKMIDKEEIKKQGVKDILQLIGLATQLPVGPIGKPVGYLMDVESGKANPTGPIDYARGLVSGQAGK